MAYDELIAGMASYMEEVSASSEVSVTDNPEVAEVADQEVDAVQEVQETAAEAESESQEAEMIFRQLDELQRMQSFVQNNGVDRTFLYFYAPKLRAMNIMVPEMESFDTIGNPNSSVSQAFLSGMAAIGESIWKFIKKVFYGIKDFFTRIVSAITNRFGDYNKRIGQLKRIFQERSIDNDKIEKATNQVMSRKDITDALGDTTKELSDSTKAFEQLKLITTSIFGANTADGNRNILVSLSEVTKLIDQYEEDTKKLKGFKGGSKTTSVKDLNISGALDCLKLAEDLATKLSQRKRIMDNAKVFADNNVRYVEQAAARSGDDNRSNVTEAKKYARLCNRWTGAMARATSNWEKAIRECLKSATAVAACLKRS